MADDEEAAEVAWLQEHKLGELIDDAVRRLLAEKPEDPRQTLARYILEGATEVANTAHRRLSGGGALDGTRKAPAAATAHLIECSEMMTEFCELMSLPVAEGIDDPAIAGNNEQGFCFEIGPQDCLLVIDMQNDFVPRGPFNESGGRLACPEGDCIAHAIVQLMALFGAKGGTVVATKDYHPLNHVSFAGHGGHLPSHCVAGHVGSYFYQPVGKRLETLYADPKTRDQVIIAFKGYHEGVDSFGGFTYSKEDAAARDRIAGLAKLPVATGEVHPEALTGCRIFNCSGRYVDGNVDIDAPPDVLAGESSTTAAKLEDVLGKRELKRLFVCGLAFDYCVLDTSCNGRKLGFEEVYLVADVARPSYIPASDFHKPPFGSGFIQDPAGVRAKLLDYGAQFCFVRHLLPKLAGKGQFEKQRTGSMAHLPGSSALVGARFPDQLGPWRLHLVPNVLGKLEVTAQPRPTDNGAFRVVLDTALQGLGVARDGVLGPVSEVNFPSDLRAKLGIPEGDVHYCFAHALKGASVLAADPRFAWCLHDPTYTFLLLGGFVYFSQEKPVAVLAVTGVGEADSAVCFGPPRSLRELTPVVQARLQPCPDGTLLHANGVVRLAAVANHELDCPWGGLVCERKQDYLVFPYQT
eukprot:TRINITY_DN15370_c0_g1_i1.p1 TRINITY_DN15370_c0_g1~~TRINITY_DN15370_c0_g1_i1.p1  ORF type:complete len:664 (+),score=169.14 TRINITY_DN15370_c0_g1_i1:87-1994(+)